MHALSVTQSGSWNYSRCALLRGRPGQKSAPLGKPNVRAGGAAFDPESGYLFVRAANAIGLNRVAKNDGSDPLVAADYSNVFARGGESVGLPGGLPLVSPPYAVLTAIDLNKGEIAWKSPLGEGSPAIRNHPLLKGVALPDRLGSPNSRGGAMVTKSGLVFIGGGDGYLYAFDGKSGAEIWRGKVPYDNAAVPMTYRTRSGRHSWWLRRVPARITRWLPSPWLCNT